MRYVVVLLAMFAVSVAGAADNRKAVTGPAAKTMETQRAVKPSSGGVRAPVLSEAVELSDVDCINLQCDLRIMTSCKTRVGCSCGKGVTICVDEIISD